MAVIELGSLSQDIGDQLVGELELTENGGFCLHRQRGGWLWWVAAVCDQSAKLGKEARGQRALNLSQIEAALAELGKVAPLLILDDAQNLAYGSLEEVRLLLGLNLAEPPAFGLVLIGDEYLLGALRLRQHRSLYSRIASYASLSPWTPAQASQYLQQSLAAVGINRPVMEPAALNLLISASGGLARSLCLLARAAWIEAASAGLQNIQPEHAQAAIERVPAAAALALPTSTTTS